MNFTDVETDSRGLVHSASLQEIDDLERYLLERIPEEFKAGDPVKASSSTFSS